MSAKTLTEKIDALVEAAFEKGRRVGVHAPYRERGWADRDLQAARAVVDKAIAKLTEPQP